MTDLFNPYAFSIGMLALLNPCGFAMLPAYLGFFLALDETPDQRNWFKTALNLNRAQIVGLTMSLGFLAVFGALGVILSGASTWISNNGLGPELTIFVSVGLIALGIAILTGHKPNFIIPQLGKGAKQRTLRSMFVFGISYAIASLGCTMPLFIVVIGTSSSGRVMTERLGAFLSYAIGMGLLATVVTLAIAVGHSGLVNFFRSSQQYIDKISAILLIVFGCYLALYGVWSEQVLNLDSEPTGWIDAIVTPVEDTYAGIAQLANSYANALGIFFLVINLAVIVISTAAKRHLKLTSND